MSAVDYSLQIDEARETAICGFADFQGRTGIFG